MGKKRREGQICQKRLCDEALAKAYFPASCSGFLNISSFEISAFMPSEAELQEGKESHVF